MRASEIVGLPVVTLLGDDVAEIRDVVFDPGRGALEGFTLNKRGFFAGRLKQVLTNDAIHGIGRAAVMVASDSELTERRDAPDHVAAPDRDRTVTGATVVTESGTALGEIADVVLQIDGGVDVVGYELAPSGARTNPAFVPLPDQKSVSGDALVVPDRLEAFLRDDLSGFGGAIDAFRAEHVADVGSGQPPRTGVDELTTKDELYAEAKRRDIPGRSSMTKAELREALDEGSNR